MTEMFKDDRSRIFWILLAISLAGVVLLLGSHWGEDDGFPWRELLRDGGIALLIAGIIAFGVERYLRERLYEEISSDLSENLRLHREESIDAIHFQRRLPPELSEAIRRTVIDSPFVLRDCVAHYDMKPVRSVDGITLVATVVSTVIVENLSEETRKWRFKERISEDGGYQAISEVSLEGLEAFDESWVLNGPNIDPYISHQRGDVIFGREVNFPPRASAKTRIVFTNEFQLTDGMIYGCAEPAINCEVTVSVPGGVFEFSGQPRHPVDEWFTGSVDNERGEHSWKITGGLTPEQGISFEWSCVVPEEEIEVSDASPQDG